MKKTDDIYRAIDGLKDTEIEDTGALIDLLDNKSNSLALTDNEKHVLFYLLEEEEQAADLPKNASEFALQQMVLMLFVHSHKDTLDALSDPEERRRFVKSITSEDLKKYELSEEDENIKALRANEAPSMTDLLDAIGFGPLVFLYEHKYAPTKAGATITEIAEKLKYPVDKVNRNFFRIWEEIINAPQHQIAFDLTPHYSIDGRKSYVLVSLEYRGKNPAPLQDYDKLVMLAANTLYEKNNGRPFTLQALYEQMGNSGKLGGVNRKKLLSSLTKLNDYWIHIDNAEEAKNQKQRNEYRHHGSLLPFEYGEKLENGQVTKTPIHLLRSAPLIEFAEDRKQITTVPRSLLQVPISQNDINIRIEDYLITEIAFIKKGSRSNKILFETLFKETGQTTTKYKNRAKEKVVAILDHFKAEGHITKYAMHPDGIEIFYDKKPAKSPARRSRTAPKR